MPYVNLPIHVIPDLGKSQFKACIRFNFQSKWEMIHEKWRIQTKTWAMFNFPYSLLTSKRFICDKDKGVEFDSIKSRRQKQMDEFRRERTNFSANSIRRKFLEAEWTNWKTTKTLPFVQICGWLVGRMGEIVQLPVFFVWNNGGRCTFFHSCYEFSLITAGGHFAFDGTPQRRD